MKYKFFNYFFQGKHRNEHYVTHFEVGNKIILISTHFVFCLSPKPMTGFKTKWKVAIRDISRIDENDGYLTFNTQIPTNNVHEYKVRISLPQEQKLYVYNSIKETVNHEQRKPLYCSNSNIKSG